jgi:hypothetical protein
MGKTLLSQSSHSWYVEVYIILCRISIRVCGNLGKEVISQSMDIGAVANMLPQTTVGTCRRSRDRFERGERNANEFACREG